MFGLESLPLLLLFSIGACQDPNVGEDNTEKPNIIFIMVDDVGWADFSYNTAENTAISTPKIDKLASQGYMFKASGHFLLYLVLQGDTKELLCSSNLHSFQGCFYDRKILCKHRTSLCHVPR